MTGASEDSQKALEDESTQYQEHPAWKRLEDQLQWYDNKSTHCHRWYKWTRFAQICLAVSIPVLSHLDPVYAKWLTAFAGGFDSCAGRCAAFASIFASVDNISRHDRTPQE